MTVGGLVDTVFRFNRLCECHLYTAPSNKSRVSHHLSGVVWQTKQWLAPMRALGIFDPIMDCDIQGMVLQASLVAA
jgi:hypothetical protein